MVTGEGRPFLVLLAVPDPARWVGFVRGLGLDPDDPGAVGHPDLVREILRRADTLLHGFPGYARIRGAVVDPEPWTVENGCLTATLKLRRKRIESRCRSALEAYYRGTGPVMTGTSG
jgi:long-chain acyl-CoA synthetase